MLSICRHDAAEGNRGRGFRHCGPIPASVQNRGGAM